jgi:hypothetical protein
MSDLGKAGSKAPVNYKEEIEAGTPKTGFDSAPRGEKMQFEPLHGHGGSGKGAH